MSRRIAKERFVLAAVGLAGLVTGLIAIAATWFLIAVFFVRVGIPCINSLFDK